jgi:MoxR-like ATPase
MTAAREHAIRKPHHGGQYYTGNPLNRRADAWRSLPRSRVDLLRDPVGYIPNPDLVDAANVALMLGQPLLLTGEPGSGKTEFASSLAYELGFDEPLKFEAKSDTVAKDLFYSFDALGRFHAAQTGKAEVAAIDFIAFAGLGRAILLANAPEDVADLLPLEQLQQEPKRSVVLIDEIDKAPRDVPNDILNEIEHMYFRIPEVGNRLVRVDSDWRPIVVITSNSEKVLPDTFLRRCIYYHIRFPNREELRRIVATRLGKSGRLVEEVLDLFEMARGHRGIEKRPGTAELLNWMTVLELRDAEFDRPLKSDLGLAATSRATLFKKSGDLALAEELIREWASA